MAEGEVTASLDDVAGNLVAEGLGGGEGTLGAEAAEEGEAERGAIGEVDGVEVEQVGFYGEGVRAERGTVADVGYGLEGFRLVA